jgi:hypothetical protein
MAIFSSILIVDMVQRVGESVQVQNFYGVKTEDRIAEITLLEVCSL